MLGRFIKTAALATSLVAATAIAATAADYTLRATANSNENDEDYDGLIVFKNYVEAASNGAIEVELFKTAITTFFVREWYYVAYAGGLLLLSTVLFKGFCRYVCPLGAVMAIGGLLRGRDWIARRVECGSPCQLCKVKCSYGAIKSTGEIQYSECFQCLECVTIHDDPGLCVPLVLAAKNGRSLQRVAAE